MATVIIAGGGKVRAEIDLLEQKSLTMNDTKRAAAEDLLRSVGQQLADFIAANP